MGTLTLEQGIERQFHQLAEETHRPEAEIIHEALASYLAADRRYVEVLSQRLAAAERGEFADEKEARHFSPGTEPNRPLTGTDVTPRHRTQCFGISRASCFCASA